MFAIAVFLSYSLQFYIPMKIIGPWFQHFFSDERQQLSDGILRILLIIVTCKEMNLSSDFHSPDSNLHFLVYIIVILAAVVPKLGPIISLFGAVFSSSLAVIFPPIIEVLTFGLDGMGKYYWKLWKNSAIVIFGVLGFVFGAYVSIVELTARDPIQAKH